MNRSAVLLVVLLTGCGGEPAAGPCAMPAGTYRAELVWASSSCGGKPYNNVGTWLLGPRDCGPFSVEDDGGSPAWGIVRRLEAMATADGPADGVVTMSTKDCSDSYTAPTFERVP